MSERAKNDDSLWMSCAVLMMFTTLLLIGIAEDRRPAPAQPASIAPVSSDLADDDDGHPDCFNPLHAIDPWKQIEHELNPLKQADPTDPCNWGW